MSGKTEFIEVECCFCHKRFNKTLHRYKEAQKYKWNFFCSRECQSKFKNKKILTQCSECSKNIAVSRSSYVKSVNKRFFCSQKCSATYNNQIRGPRSEETKLKIRNSLYKYFNNNGITRTYCHKNNSYVKSDRLIIPLKECPICHKSFKGHQRFCCSKECGYIYQFGSLPYTKDEVINMIVSIGKNTSKTPQKRDCETKLYHSAVRFFGTWNKAMMACNLKPNHSKYQKTRLKCKDGHIADSISERTIDDWLFFHNIRHEKNKKYPNSKMDCDFYLVDYDLWVEYFGLFGGNIKEYNDTMETKKEIIKANKIKFVQLVPNDLYGNKSISYDEKLTKIFESYINI